MGNSKKKPLKKEIIITGFGGQGIVLSSVIFGTAAVERAGLNAVQTQSYGSEARGGECQAELILSEGPIHSPLADRVDILVAMSQLALDRYLDRLRAGGTLILDPELVEKPERSDIKIVRVPATQMASEIGPAWRSMRRWPVGVSARPLPSGATTWTVAPSPARTARRRACSTAPMPSPTGRF